MRGLPAVPCRGHRCIDAGERRVGEVVRLDGLQPGGDQLWLLQDHLQRLPFQVHAPTPTGNPAGRSTRLPGTTLGGVLPNCSHDLIGIGAQPTRDLPGVLRAQRGVLEPGDDRCDRANAGCATSAVRNRGRSGKR
jgi:hypothetical protein